MSNEGANSISSSITLQITSLAWGHGNSWTFEEENYYTCEGWGV